MRKLKRQYIIPVFIPHLGCPNDCSFCNQKSISGTIKMPTKEEVIKIIDENIKNIRDEDADKEIAFYGGSFTGIEIEKQKEYLEIANKYIESKKINGIRLSTRPDYINKEIFPRKLGHKIKNAEIIRDNSDYNDFYIVSKTDTESIIETASELYKYGVEFIKKWCIENDIQFEN